MSRGGRGAGRKQSPPDARLAALRALVAVESGKQARLRDAIDLRHLSARDRDLAWELCQGTERLHRMLDFVLARFVSRRLPKVAMVRSVLRLGAYQLLMLSRVPPRAAVHATVGLLPDRRGFPNAVLRRLAEHVHERAADPAQPRREWSLPDGPNGPRCLVFDDDAVPAPATAAFLAVRYGLPPFLVERWVAHHGQVAAATVCQAASVPPAVFLRATARVPAGTDLVAALADQGVAVEPLAPAGAGRPPMFRVTGGAPFLSRAFAEGWFMAQDPTAVAAACAVAAQPGDRVFDLCAAPGTKTTVLAEAVGADGTVYAWDAKAWKLKFVRDNAERLGLADRIRYPDGPHLPEPVDRVLADVPCSNTGVLARRVEVRRRLTEAAIRELVPVQVECLERALAACRSGGRVVYSTCSIEPEENREVVERVLGTGCELVEERLTLPDPAGGDGGYYAILARK